MVAELGGATERRAVSYEDSPREANKAEPPRKDGLERRHAKTSELIAGDADVVAIRTAASGRCHQKTGRDPDAEAFAETVAEHRIDDEARALAFRPIRKTDPARTGRAKTRRTGGRLA